MGFLGISGAAALIVASFLPEKAVTPLVVYGCVPSVPYIYGCVPSVPYMYYWFSMPYI